MSIHLENVRFKPVPRPREDGSMFLGYADVTVVCAKALPDQSDFAITVRDIEVAVLADGRPVIGFKAKKVERADGTNAYFEYAFTRTAASRAWLTATIHALPEVKRVIAVDLVRAMNS